MRDSIEETFKACCYAAPDTIVLGTDLSDIASLLPHAIAQAKASRASLQIVHALVPMGTFAPEAGAVTDIDPETLERDARLAMDEAAREVRENGLRCAIVVRQGFPADVIAEVVRESDAGRVIVATHGRRGLKRLVLGSVAREILKTSEVPVCTVGPQCKAPSSAGLAVILHPTGLGPECEINARLALDLAQYSRAELTLMHVLDRKLDVMQHLDAQLASQKLEALLPPNPGAFRVPVRTWIVRGDMTAEILRASEETSADLIILGVNPAASFWKGESGKTAYSIVASASCPVLSFRTFVSKPSAASASVHPLYALH